MDSINKFVEKENLVVIQLGAGDGTTDDTLSQYIRKYKWKGLLIEPVDWLFSMLESKYKNNDDVVTLNAAVSNLSLNSLDENPDYLYWQKKPLPGQPHHHITMLPYNSVDTVDFVTNAEWGVDRYKALNNIKIVPRSKINFLTLQEIIDQAKEKFGKVDLIYTTLYVHKCMTKDGMDRFLSICSENDVSMISYDKIPIGDVETFPRKFEETLQHPGWISAGVGMGELEYDHPEFGESTPMDYGINEPDKKMSDLDVAPGKNRIDRDLLLNKKIHK